MAKKKHAKAASQASHTPGRLAEAFVEVEGLLQGRRWAEARTWLEELDRRYPGRHDVLTALAEVLHELNDLPAYLGVVERLSRLAPNNPDLTLALGGAYLVSVYPFLARRAFRRFLERWPTHAEAEHARETVAELDQIIPQLLSEAGLAEDDLEIATLHEEARLLMERGQLRQARQVGEQVLRLRPDFAPILNNLSMIAAMEGRLDEAIGTACRILDAKPDDLHALANLVVFLVRAGRLDEARATAERLRATHPNRDDVWVKKAEARSYLGDDAGVLEVYEGAKKADLLDTPENGPFLEHLAGVAALRLGQSDSARRHWERALKLSPGLAVAQENLDDSKKKPGERHGPWAFPPNQWLAQSVIEEMLRATKREPSRGGRASGEATRRFLQQRPELARLVPVFLDRGDPVVTEFAVRLAAEARTPELLAALRDFALGQRGSDVLRNLALTGLQEADAAPPGPIRMWVQGEWREIQPMTFEISGEPVKSRHSPQVQKLFLEAHEALAEGDGVKGERLLQEALELEPGAPDILNNLAAAYQLLGKDAESDAVIRQVFEEHPDYLFGRVGMARIATRERRFNDATKLLESLLASKKLHTSEFRALAMAEVELHLAQKNQAAARSWLDLWASVDPDHPSLLALRREVEGRRWPF